MFKIEGLDDFENALLDIVNIKLPSELERFLLEMAYRVERKTKKKTPLDTGTLRRSWKVSKVKRKGKQLFIEVYNNVEYAPSIEYGHMTRNNSKFIPGRKMLTLSVKAVEKEMPKHLKKMLNTIIGD